MMAALPNLITVEQYQEIEDPPGGRHELHAGELLFLRLPNRTRHLMRRRLANMLEPRMGEFGEVWTGVAYRPMAQFELWFADVAVVSHVRADAVDRENCLQGAPELVIEIRSPSNRPRGLTTLAAYCLSERTIEFWVVDMDRKSVTVTRRDGVTTVYGPGQSVPLTSFGGGSLAVDEIFG